MNANDPHIDPSTPPQERGEILGFSLIAILLALMAASLRADGGAKDVLMGLHLVAWGLMFLASYHFSHKTFFLRGLVWFCTTMSCPSTPKMAFFYATLCTLMGGASVLAGLGLF